MDYFNVENHYEINSGVKKRPVSPTKGRLQMFQVFKLDIRVF